MAKHKSFTVATKVNVYFCDPQSPWQRGPHENTNGLLRQHFPRRPTCPDTPKQTSTSSPAPQSTPAKNFGL